MGGFGCGKWSVQQWSLEEGCFSWNELNPLIPLHGNVNAEEYKDILTSLVLPMVEDHFSDDLCLNQHDNAPYHKAGLVRELTGLHSVDLKPIEHLWEN